MDSARNWFQKFQPRDRFRATTKKKEPATMGKDGSNCLSGDEAPSNVTKQKVAAAKQFIENHYKEQMKNLQERKERRNILEKKLPSIKAIFDEESETSDLPANNQPVHGSFLNLLPPRLEVSQEHKESQ